LDHERRERTRDFGPRNPRKRRKSRKALAKLGIDVLTFASARGAVDHSGPHGGPSEAAGQEVRAGESCEIPRIPRQPFVPSPRGTYGFAPFRGFRGPNHLLPRRRAKAAKYHESRASLSCLSRFFVPFVVQRFAPFAVQTPRSRASRTNPPYPTPARY
jgi:hypothetical protein